MANLLQTGYWKVNLWKNTFWKSLWPKWGAVSEAISTYVKILNLAAISTATLNITVTSTKTFDIDAISTATLNKDV